MILDEACPQTGEYCASRALINKIGERATIKLTQMDLAIPGKGILREFNRGFTQIIRKPIEERTERVVESVELADRDTDIVKCGQGSCSSMTAFALNLLRDDRVLSRADYSDLVEEI